MKKASMKLKNEVVKLFLQGFPHETICQFTNLPLGTAHDPNSVRGILSDATRHNKDLYERRKHGGRSI